jgi:hypothetical protein
MTDTFAVEVAEPVIEIGHFELRGFRRHQAVYAYAKRGSSPAVPNRPSRAPDATLVPLHSDYDVLHVAGLVGAAMCSAY